MKHTQISLRQHLPQFMLVLILMGASVYIAFSPPGSLMHWYNNDDGFFYYKVAQNIVNGRGVTFDGVTPTNGFHPLWMLVCVLVFAVFRGSLLLPLRVIVILFGLMQTGSALLLYDILGKRIGRWTAFFLAISFFFAWIIYQNTFSGGLESALSCLMTIWLWYLAVKYKNQKALTPRRLVMLGWVAGITVLSRLDNIFLVLFLGVWSVFDSRQDNRRLFTDILAAFILVVAVAIFRVGYDIHTLQKEILAATFLLVLGSVVFSYVSGLYSTPGWLPSHLPAWERGALTWVGALVNLWGGSAVLFMAGILPVFSKSILAMISAVWLVYIFASRWLWGRRASERGATPLRTWELFLSWSVKPLAFFLPVLLCVGGYMLWSQANFHTPLPVSGQIKQWWGTLGFTTYGSPIHSARGLQDYLLGGDGPLGFLYQIPLLAWLRSTDPEVGGFVIWILLALLWLITGQIKKSPNASTPGYTFGIAPLLAATVYRVLYFYVVGYVHMRSWYWTVESIFGIVLLAALLDRWWIGMRAHPPARKAVQALVLISAVWEGILTLQGFRSLYSYSASSAADQDYLAVPREVEAATPPGAIIGTPGGGSLSYFIHDRTIVNLDGLMNSKEYFDALKALDTREWMAERGVEYIFANDYAITQSMPYSELFNGCLLLQNQIYGKTIYLYTCH